jgi:hypothetical protein
MYSMIADTCYCKAVSEADEETMSSFRSKHRAMARAYKGEEAGDAHHAAQLEAAIGAARDARATVGEGTVGEGAERRVMLLAMLQSIACLNTLTCLKVPEDLTGFPAAAAAGGRACVALVQDVLRRVVNGCRPSARIRPSHDRADMVHTLAKLVEADDRLGAEVTRCFDWAWEGVGGGVHIVAYPPAVKWRQETDRSAQDWSKMQMDDLRNRRRGELKARNAPGGPDAITTMLLIHSRVQTIELNRLMLETMRHIQAQSC